MLTTAGNVQSILKFTRRRTRGDGHSREGVVERTRPVSYTHLQNRGLHRNNTSKFKGVSWLKAKEKWRAQIRVENNDIWLGLFSSPELAARAYDAAALKYHGSFACTNEMLGLLEPVSLGMAA